MAELSVARSHTEPPVPEQHKTQRAHLPRRLHANSFRSKTPWVSGNHNPLRHTAKETQSAIDPKPPTSLDHLLRRERKITDASTKGNPPQRQTGEQAPTTLPDPVSQRPARTGDVAEAKRYNVKREEELRANLKSVEEVGMSSTRQLDDTYYAILEKASILRSTVAGLQQLADESKRLHTSFKDDSSNLERQTKDNLQGWGNFEQQENKINDLVGQLNESRTKTDHLNERLESARLRVEAYELRDTLKQAKRRTQLRLTWAGLVALIVLIIAILIARDRKRVGDVVEQQLLRIGDLVDDVAAPVRSRASPTEDPYLEKLFDL